MEPLLILATCFLAYSNGANDNFKGVASLYGSGTATYRVAIAWATITTVAGSLAGVLMAQGLLRAFSGRGVVPDQVANSNHFLLAVAAGAGLTVIAATRFGLPISTTHALTGSILGTGLMAAGRVNITALGSSILLPLLLSPLLAVALAALVYPAFRYTRSWLGIHRDSCVCLATQAGSPALSPSTLDGAVFQEELPSISVVVGDQHSCRRNYSGRLLGIQAQTAIDGLHFLSAGAVSFSRGLNDTPKIAAALVAVRELNAPLGVGAVALAMAFGGLLSAARVADTMSTKITTMSHGQGLTSNLTTGALVLMASLFGLPVSTTHVSVGALAGIGWVTGNANNNVLRGIGLSWLVTLPFATACSAALWLLVEYLHG